MAAIDDPAALETIYDREADETLLTPGGQKFVLSRQFTKEAVSYTQLDVYKRQFSRRATDIAAYFSPPPHEMIGRRESR